MLMPRSPFVAEIAHIAAGEGERQIGYIELLHLSVMNLISGSHVGERKSTIEPESVALSREQLPEQQFGWMRKRHRPYAGRYTRLQPRFSNRRRNAAEAACTFREEV